MALIGSREPTDEERRYGLSLGPVCGFFRSLSASDVRLSTIAYRFDSEVVELLSIRQLK